jgi:hypothetical protein
MQRRTAILALTLLPGAALAQRRPVLQLSVLAEGVLLVNGSLTTLSQLDLTLEDLKSKHGVVWYFRENAQGDPPASGIEALKLIQKHALPLSLSTRPDFSDYVDASGRSLPREK